jgi:hypothetical protein
MPATVSPPRSSISTLLAGMVPRFLRGEVTEENVVDAVRDLEAEPIRKALADAVAAQDARKPHLALVATEAEVKRRLKLKQEEIANAWGDEHARRVEFDRQQQSRLQERIGLENQIAAITTSKNYLFASPPAEILTAQAKVVAQKRQLQLQIRAAQERLSTVTAAIGPAARNLESAKAELKRFKSDFHSEQLATFTQTHTDILVNKERAEESLDALQSQFQELQAEFDALEARKLEA